MNKHQIKSPTSLSMCVEDEYGDNKYIDFLIDTAWLETYLDEDVNVFLSTYTSDDSIEVYDAAVLDDAIVYDFNNDACKLKMVYDIKSLMNNTPNGIIRDADTILADIIENADFEVSGIAHAIFNIWENSSDRKGIEELFYCLTDVYFDDYLQTCLANTTRSN